MVSSMLAMTSDYTALWQNRYSGKIRDIRVAFDSGVNAQNRIAKHIGRSHANHSHEADLAPLLADPAHMDELLDLIGSLRDYSSNRTAGQVRLETSLLDATKKCRITTSTVPGAGQGMPVSKLTVTTSL